MLCGMYRMLQLGTGDSIKTGKAQFVHMHMYLLDMQNIPKGLSDILIPQVASREGNKTVKAEG